MFLKINLIIMNVSIIKKSNRIACSIILSDDGLLTISDCGHRF